jgi:hypothetical protein
MNSSWSVTLYRFLMQAYPAEFRNQYGDPVDQAFRDMHRDAFQKRGYLGLALHWFHVVPDFLFSAGEVLLSKAGDFLKWRFRLQWVVACSLGFALSRCGFLILGREFFEALETRGAFWRVLGAALGPAIFMAGLGLMQSRVLAGRCFRKKEWVLYGLAGAVLSTIVFQPLFISWGVLRRLMEMLMNVSPAVQHGMLQDALFRVTGSIPLLIWGTFTGAFQSAAIKNDAITRYRWVKACIAGYFLSAVAGGFVIPYVINAPLPVLELVLTSFAAGAVLGLITSGPLEQILFSVQSDSKEQS